MVEAMPRRTGRLIGTKDRVTYVDKDGNYVEDWLVLTKARGGWGPGTYGSVGFKGTGLMRFPVRNVSSRRRYSMMRGEKRDPVTGLIDGLFKIRRK